MLWSLLNNQGLFLRPIRYEKSEMNSKLLGQSTKKLMQVCFLRKLQIQRKIFSHKKLSIRFLNEFYNLPLVLKSQRWHCFGSQSIILRQQESGVCRVATTSPFHQPIFSRLVELTLTRVVIQVNSIFDNMCYFYSYKQSNLKVSFLVMSVCKYSAYILVNIKFKGFDHLAHSWGGLGRFLGSQ